MGKYNGSSQCVLKPKTAQEVSNIMKWCNEHNIAVVPQGGNTGLVGMCAHYLLDLMLRWNEPFELGGGVPVRDEVVISLANMNQIRSFDPVSGMFSLNRPFE